MQEGGDKCWGRAWLTGQAGLWWGTGSMWKFCFPVVSSRKQDAGQQVPARLETGVKGLMVTVK